MLVAISVFIMTSGQTPQQLAPVIYLLLLVSLVYGVLFVMPIGGADMPVVISLLNSLTGIAATMAGFIYNNQAMILGGILVGAAGTILTILMCNAMNRSLLNVIIGAFGGGGASSGKEQLGDMKETVTTEDLPYIISDVLKSGTHEQSIKLINYYLTVARGLKPVASMSVFIDNEIHTETAVGDGQYDAFMKAMWKIYERLKKPRPVLTDYLVTIPPGGKTDALVETTITWVYQGVEYKTRGLDADQTGAAIKATMKMLNIIANNELKTGMVRTEKMSV